MRLTTRTDLAMRALMYCAHHYPQILRKSDIARACDVNENHLAQVIHVLGVRGFLATKRGRQGGVTLARPAAEISVGAVFRALEAEVPFAECFEAEGGHCPLRRACGLKCLLSRAVAAFYATLDVVTLDTLLGEEIAFSALFGPQSAAVSGVLPAPLPAPPTAAAMVGPAAVGAGGASRQLTYSCQVSPKSPCAPFR